MYLGTSSFFLLFGVRLLILVLAFFLQRAAWTRPSVAWIPLRTRYVDKAFSGPFPLLTCSPIMLPAAAFPLQRQAQRSRSASGAHCFLPQRRSVLSGQWSVVSGQWSVVCD